MSEDIQTVEVEARKFGWVPQEDFKGEQDEWKDAATFVKRGKEINGFLRKDLEKIENTLAKERSAHQQELAEIRQSMDEFSKYHKETKERAYKLALEELKAQKVLAIEQNDGSLVVDIDDQIANIKEAQKPVVEEKKSAASVSPEFNKIYTEWAKENIWYATDPELRAYADLVADEVTAEFPNKKGKEYLDEVTKRVKDEKAEKFTNPARQNTNVSSSSDGRAPAVKGGKGYNDLPPEAKAACDKYVKQKLLTREQYLSEYDWE